MIYITKPVLPDLDNYFEELKDIWKSEWITNMGPKHNELEIKLKELLKVPYLSLFNNGTIALITAIKSMNLPVGSEVITTPFTFAATPHALVWNGLTPVFCDIKKEDMTIDPSSIRKAINKNTSAILAVHVYGFPCDVGEIARIAEEFNLKVIYDAAHAFSTEINGRGIGSYGDITMFSFHATKLFNTIEGGCLTFTNYNLEQKIKDLRNFGIRSEEEVQDIGINGKMNEFQAAMGLENLKILNTIKEKKKRIKKYYDEELSKIKGIRIPKPTVVATDSYQYYPIVIEEDYKLDRNELYDYLKRNEIYARKYFYPVCSDFDCYKDKNIVKVPFELKNTNYLKNKMICLPYYYQLNNIEQQKIIELIK